MENKNFKEELFREYELKRADALERKNIETKNAYEKRHFFKKCSKMAKKYEQIMNKIKKCSAKIDLF